MPSRAACEQVSNARAVQPAASAPFSPLSSGLRAGETRTNPQELGLGRGLSITWHRGGTWAGGGRGSAARTACRVLAPEGFLFPFRVFSQLSKPERVTFRNGGEVKQ